MSPCARRGVGAAPLNPRFLVGGGARPPAVAAGLALAATIAGSGDEAEPDAEFNPFLADDEAGDSETSDDDAEATAPEPEEEGAQA